MNNDNAHACEQYWFRLLECFASFRLNKSQFASAVFRFCVFRGFRVVFWRRPDFGYYA